MDSQAGALPHHKVKVKVAQSYPTRCTCRAHLPNPGIKLTSPTWQANSLPAEPQGKPLSLSPKPKITSVPTSWHEESSGNLGHWVKSPKDLCVSRGTKLVSEKWLLLTCQQKKGNNKDKTEIMEIENGQMIENIKSISLKIINKIGQHLFGLTRNKN